MTAILQAKPPRVLSARRCKLQHCADGFVRAGPIVLGCLSKDGTALVIKRGGISVEVCLADFPKLKERDDSQ